MPESTADLIHNDNREALRGLTELNKRLLEEHLELLSSEKHLADIKRKASAEVLLDDSAKDLKNEASRQAAIQDRMEVLGLSDKTRKRDRALLQYEFTVREREDLILFIRSNNAYLRALGSDDE